MKTTKNKARNKRFARKAALRQKHGFDECPAKQDTLRACRRIWGKGLGK